MTDCCNYFASSIVSATREPNPIWRADDECGFKASYKGLVGQSYPAFVPVKFGAAPGTVEPALDGVDAIGLAGEAKLSVAAGHESLTVIRHAADVPWAVVAEAVGESATDAAAWWAVHKELAKVGIFVSF